MTASLDRRRATFFLLAFWHEPWMPEFGGPVRFWEIAKALAARGERVEAFVPAYGGVRDLPGVRLRRIPLVDAGGLRPLSFYLASSLALVWHALRTRRVVLYMRTMPHPFAHLVARACRMRFVVEVNDDLFRAHVRRGLSPLRRWLVARIERASCRAAEVVVVHVGGVGEALTHAWGVDPSRIVRLPGGTDPDLFYPRPAHECRAALKLADGPWVGFVGTFYDYQGLQTLVEAAPLIRRDVPGARFLIVGRGPAEGRVHDAVHASNLADCIQFAGWVPYGDVPAHVGAMDVCVAPLAADRGLAMPMKIFDYMACARPVVLGAPETLAGVWAECPGIVRVEAADPRALAAAVVALLRDAPRRAALGEASRRAVEERYSWRAIAGRIAALGGPDGR